MLSVGAHNFHDRLFVIQNFTSSGGGPEILLYSFRDVGGLKSLHTYILILRQHLPV